MRANDYNNEEGIMRYILGVIFAVFSLACVPSYADTISSRTENLEQEVAELKRELAELKSTQTLNNTSSSKVLHHKIITQGPRINHNHQSVHSQTVSTSQSTSSQQAVNSPSSGDGAAPPGETVKGDVSGSKGPYEDIENVEDMPKTGTQFLPVSLDVPGQAFVSTGPYIGNEIDFAGSDLIINTPKINADATLLNVRKNIENRLIKLGHPLGSYPHLLLSGIVEGQVLYRKNGTGGNNSDIDLTSANLDLYILGAPCITGLIEFAYDNEIGDVSGAFMNRQRVANSRLFLNQGMVILGNFRCSPWYLSLGQMFVPFGTYSSNMIASPLTKILFRTKARAINIGYWGQGDIAVYGSAYAFRGDTRVIRDARVNNGGVNLGVRAKCGEVVKFDVGAGVITNSADALGVQFTGNRPLFEGFGSPFNVCGPNGDQPCGSERLAHKVPAADIHATLSLGKEWDFIAEYIAATKSYAPVDLTYKTHGARPQAGNIEAAYTFQNTCKPLSVAVGYGFTKEALAFGFPSQRYAAVINTSLWRDTLQSLEFRRDKFYGASAISSGSNVEGPTGTGKWNSTVTAQMDIYF